MWEGSPGKGKTIPKMREAFKIKKRLKIITLASRKN
jgi:hypothetical protein